MNPRAVVLLVSLVACDRTPARRDEATRDEPRPADCTPATNERLGITFVRVCSAPNAFWVSTVPIGCSGGDHDVLDCPPVVAVGASTTAPRVAAVVDAETAHRVCTMRFAGRLPTRDERVRVHDTLGLATVVVSESTAEGGVKLDELAEWTTARACDHPTLLDPTCGADRFPWEASPNIAWDRIVTCETRTTTTAAPRTVIDVNGACPFGGSAHGRELPCAVRPTTVDRVGPFVLLSCGPARAVARERVAPSTGAAFRCVVDAWL